MAALLLSYGFRPLFLCVIAAAVVFIPWWTAVWLGVLPWQGVIDPMAWHGHEMLFGFVGAAIGGFLLTAVANWTGRPPIQGVALAAVVAGWLLPRVLLAAGTGLAYRWIVLADLAYWLLLTTLIGREIIAARNYRNLKVVAILAGFAALTLAFHWGTLAGLTTDTTRPALRGTVMLVVLLITLIGGRIIPAFTGNWLRMHGQADTLPAGFGHIDRLTFVFTVVAGAAWSLFPGHAVTGSLAVAAGVLQLARLSRWQGARTLPEPLLFVLHAGYSWLGIGFIGIGLAAFMPTIPQSLGLHALGVGAMTSMILAVSSRAAMGHTNRPLSASKTLSLSFAAIHGAALLRLIAAVHPGWIAWSAALWVVAAGLFAIAVVPILVGPRQ